MIGINIKRINIVNLKKPINLYFSVIIIKKINRITMETKEIITKVQIYRIEESGNEKKMLIEKAQEACGRAYAPYSNYHVGAAILLDTGEIITGNNQENAAYPSGLCAERTAFFYANSKYPNMKVKMIAVAAFHNGEFSKEVCTPCGSCRQVMSEMEEKNKEPIKILMCSKDTVYELNSVRDLLPLGFGFESMV